MQETDYDEVMKRDPLELPALISEMKESYSNRLHQHVREHRECIPLLRMKAGEADHTMFYMIQLLAGNASSNGRPSDNQNTTVVREWLLDKLDMTSGSNKWNDQPECHNNHRAKPGIIVRSMDTDIICIGLACMNHLEEYGQLGLPSGWHYSKRTQDMVWLEPRFRWSVYADFVSREVTMGSDMEYGTGNREEEEEQERRTGSRSHPSHPGEFFLLAKIRRRSEKIRLDDFMNLGSVYSHVLEQLNPKPLREALSSFETARGYLECEIYAFVAAVKAAGDDYVLNPVSGIPMGWYTTAIFKYGSYCDPVTLPAMDRDRTVKPSPIDLVRRMGSMGIDPDKYLNLTKAYVIECYSRKNVIRENATPATVTLPRLASAIKSSRQADLWLPLPPFFAPNAMRTL
jgi:hypothetical protein